MNRWKKLGDIPAETAESKAMSKDLKKRGFRFVGPTVCYAFMQACGLVNDHVVEVLSLPRGDMIAEREGLMATTTDTRAAFSDEQLQELVGLIQEADSVELKLTVPDADQSSTLRALEVDPLQAQIRQVFFFDTPGLDLDKQGLVVRARRSQKKGDDTVVKLRPVVPSELPKSLRRSPDFGVEVDASPEGFVCSGSLKGVPKSGEVQKAVLGKLPLRKLFSKEQRALFSEHAPEGIGLDDLSILGPILVLKLKQSPHGFDRQLVGEAWFYPDGSRILELSTKCEPSEAFQVAAETRAFLSSRGIDLDSEQQTKTRTALEFFSKNLGA